ncbi:N-glycosylation protein-domain-containing protein [Flagelloscypha sp. PMI_526]|nr:N-glycosylation protein-domain-containing protein [Flagelloscypha sp. PMI_526]
MNLLESRHRCQTSPTTLRESFQTARSSCVKPPRSTSEDNFLFTPALPPAFLHASRYTVASKPPPYSSLPRAFTIPSASSDSEPSDWEMDTETDDEPSPRSPPSRSPSFRFLANARTRQPQNVKLISTSAPGVGAGETETEMDEPSRHLPTARHVPQSKPIVPPTTFQQNLVPLLFEFARFLSIVPAAFGVLWCILRLFHPPPASHFSYTSRPPPEPIDYLLSSMWAILTAYQALGMTSGLFRRWYLYYSPTSTLIRLVALQGICWPATQFTLLVLDGASRPVTAWAIIGTTTCISRSVQIWVTSNLWWSKTSPSGTQPGSEGGYWRRVVGGGTWGGRRWDWEEVGKKCMFPAGCLYFLMAWIGEIRREW